MPCSTRRALSGLAEAGAAGSATRAASAKETMAGLFRLRRMLRMVLPGIAKALLSIRIGSGYEGGDKPGPDASNSGETRYLRDAMLCRRLSLPRGYPVPVDRRSERRHCVMV